MNNKVSESHQYAISSITVLPTHIAPPLNTARTAGAVDVAAEWVPAQSGLPKPVTRPSMSNISLTAKVRPFKGSSCPEELGFSTNFSVKAP
uniref:Uncharacterized protein MANES_09G165600 n=1 Tax=Rhizophora mucronata TaxID=61149 RepID=A0A2P2MRP1_RHIMU